MKNILKKIIAGVCCLSMLLACIPAPSVKAETIADQVTQTIAYKEYDTLTLAGSSPIVLKFTAPSAGTLNLDFSPKEISMYYQLYDENYNYISGDISYGSYGQSWNFTVSSAGTYYLRLWTRSSYNYYDRSYMASFYESKDVQMEICPVVKKGKTITLDVSFKNCKDKSVQWSSSNKKVATVTSSGKVKGIKKGTATIKVWNKSGMVRKIKVKVI